MFCALEFIYSIVAKFEYMIAWVQRYDKDKLLLIKPIPRPEIITCPELMKIAIRDKKKKLLMINLSVHSR